MASPTNDSKVQMRKEQGRGIACFMCLDAPQVGSATTRSCSRAKAKRHKPLGQIGRHTSLEALAIILVAFNPLPVSWQALQSHLTWSNVRGCSAVFGHRRHADSEMPSTPLVVSRGLWVQDPKSWRMVLMHGGKAELVEQASQPQLNTAELSSSPARFWNSRRVLSAEEDANLGHIANKSFGLQCLNNSEVDATFFAELATYGDLYTPEMAYSVRAAQRSACLQKARQTVFSQHWVREHYKRHHGCLKEICSNYLFPPLEVVKGVLSVKYPVLNARRAGGFVENMVREHIARPCAEESATKFMERATCSFLAHIKKKEKAKYVGKMLEAISRMRFHKIDCSEFVWALQNDFQGKVLHITTVARNLQYEGIVASWLHRQGIPFLTEETIRAAENASVTPDFVMAAPGGVRVQVLRPADNRGDRIAIGDAYEVNIQWIDVKNMYFTMCGGDARAKRIEVKAQKYAAKYGPGAIVFTHGFAEPISDRLAKFGVAVLDGSFLFEERVGNANASTGTRTHLKKSAEN